MIRRVIAAAALFVLLMTAAALAEGMTPFTEYAARLGAEEWKTEGIDALRSASAGEGVSVSVCLDGGDVAALTVEWEDPEGTGPSGEALAAVGALDLLPEHELSALPSLPEGQASRTGGLVVYRLVGKGRSALCLCRAGDADRMAWQAVHGGEKLHSSPYCSGMDVSRMITAKAAAQLGIADCEICRAGRRASGASLDAGA